MQDSNSSSWRQPYLKALNETDETKLAGLVYAAEGAIFLRMQELANSTDHHKELSEIRAACAALRSIQVNKLGWPSAIQDSAVQNRRTSMRDAWHKKPADQPPFTANWRP
jgi:hypothetical protein